MIYSKKNLKKMVEAAEGTELEKAWQEFDSLARQLGATDPREDFEYAAELFERDLESDDYKKDLETMRLVVDLEKKGISFDEREFELGDIWNGLKFYQTIGSLETNLLILMI